MFVSPSPVAFNIFGIPMYYYGLTMALALICGVLVSVKVQYKFYPQLDPDLVYDISPYAILSGILFARLYYCLLNLDFYFYNPFEILWFRHGGISIHGAIFGGILALWILSKSHKVPFLRLCDIFSFGLVIAQAVGRWGNFFNSEAFGVPTNLPWKLYIPVYMRPEQYVMENFFHPTFLYESILDVLIFVFLLILQFRLKDKKDGLIAGVYLVLYSIVRIFVEHLRVDSALDIFSVPIATIVSVFIIIAVSVAFVVYSKKSA